MKAPRVSRAVALVVAPLALASAFSLAQCDSDGVTPVCPGDGGDCITPPGMSSASVILVGADGGIVGAGGSGGAAGSGAAGSSAAGSSGSGGTSSAAGSGGEGGATPDAGLTTLLDAKLDLGLVQ